MPESERQGQRLMGFRCGWSVRRRRAKRSLLNRRSLVPSRLGVSGVESLFGEGDGFRTG